MSPRSTEPVAVQRRFSVGGRAGLVRPGGRTVKRTALSLSKGRATHGWWRPGHMGLVMATVQPAALDALAANAAKRV